MYIPNVTQCICALSVLHNVYTQCISMSSNVYNCVPMYILVPQRIYGIYIGWQKPTCHPMYILSPNVYWRSPKNVTQCIYPMYIDVYIHWVIYIGLHKYTLGIYISMHLYTLGNIFFYIHWVYTLECIIYIGVFFLLWGFVDVPGYRVDSNCTLP